MYILHLEININSKASFLHARLFISLCFMIFIIVYNIYLFICLFIHLYTFISTFQFRDKFSVSTFQREFKFHSEKAMQGYLFVCLWCLCFLYYSETRLFICLCFMIVIIIYIYSYVIIYVFIHLHINILKPSHCLNSIQRQLFCINFSRRIQISELKSHARLFICLLMMSF